MTTAPTTHKRLLAWVEEVAELTQPDADLLVRRFSGGVRRALRAPVGGWNLRAPLGRQAAEFLSLAIGSRRRRPRGGPHVHLLRARGGRRADEQLARPGGDARHARGPLPWLDARPDHVRGAVLDGPARLTDRAHRRAGHGLVLRGLLDADHDPHGPGRARRAGRGWPLRALRALGGNAARGRRRGRPVAVQRRQQVHRPLPRVARDLVVRIGLRRQRPARQEVLRAADRVGDGPRRGLARRAHADPQAHLTRGRGSSTWRAPSRPRVARPTWQC